MRYAGHQAKKKLVPPPPKQVAGVNYLTKHPLPDGPKSVLHVGCGDYLPEKLYPAFRGPDWTEVRLDIEPKVKPDVLGDIRTLDGVPDNSHDTVWSSHNIEHLFAHEVELALRSFLRVLKPGGYLLLTCPDLQSICALVAAGKLIEPAYQSPNGPISPLDVIYGFGKPISQGLHFMQHKTGFTRKSLAQAMASVGFADVECIQDGEFALWACGRKSAPAACAA